MPFFRTSAVACLVVAVVAANSCRAETPATRPNVLLVLCDDLGYGDVGFNGCRDIQTPELDALARGGTICTSAYVSHPFCGPSRMGLMTGRYAHAFGGAFNLPPYGLGIDAYNKRGIPSNEKLISEVLQQAGYYTIAVGKWHLGFGKPYHPNVRGFDEHYGFLGGGHMYFPERYGPIYERQSRAAKTHINEYVTPLELNGKQVEETEYMTDGLSREADRFVRKAAKQEKPFFLYLAYNAPHTPLEAKEEDLKHYSNIKDTKRRTYAAMVHAVDRGVGRVVAALKETGQYENTLIIFFSDNGGKTSAGASNVPLARGKGSVYEGGCRVPMFFHWPGHVPAAVKFDHPISALDLYPTLTGLAGGEIAADKQLDGRNIWSDFIAGKDPRGDSKIFALRYRDGFSEVGVRQGPWKACRDSKGPWKLFNLDDDIGERRDLSKQHPDLVRQLVAAAKQWSQNHQAPRWFHDLRARDQWNKAQMPDYDEAFE